MFYIKLAINQSSSGLKTIFKIGWNLKNQHYGWFLVGLLEEVVKLEDTCDFIKEAGKS